LINASELWIAEMDQMIEIMPFSVSIFVMGVSRTLSLNATQLPSHHEDTLKRTTAYPRHGTHQVHCLAMLEDLNKLM
jgi:hypothetical protein